MANDLSRTLVTNILSTDQIVFISDPGGTPVNVRITLADYTNVVFDTTPQLGGNLDPNGFIIADTSVSPEIPILGFVATAGDDSNVEIESGKSGLFTGPTIRAVGPDANLDLLMSAKGTGSVAFSSDAFFVGDMSVAFGDIIVGTGDITLSQGDFILTQGTVQVNGATGQVLLNTGGPTGVGDIRFDDHLYDASSNKKILHINRNRQNADARLYFDWDGPSSPLFSGLPMLSSHTDSTSPFQSRDWILTTEFDSANIRIRSPFLFENGVKILDEFGQPALGFEGTLTSPESQNYVSVATGGVVTVNGPTISPDDIDLGLRGKNNGFVRIQSNLLMDGTDIYDTNGNTILGFAPVASADNYVDIANSTSNPIISAVGADTNISLILQAKGTGGIQAWMFGGGVFTTLGGGIFSGGTLTTVGDFSFTGAADIIMTGTANYIVDAVGNELIGFPSTVAGAVSFLEIQNAAINNDLVLKARSSAGGSNAGIRFESFGNGWVSAGGFGKGFSLDIGNMRFTTGNIVDAFDRPVLGIVQGAAVSPEDTLTNYLTVASTLGGAPILSVDGPTISPDDLSLQINAKGAGDIIVGSSIIPVDNSGINPDTIGTSSKPFRRYYVHDGSSGTPRNTFAGIYHLFGTVDWFVGDDNVFPSFYAQRATVSNSVNNDNTDDYSNLYQGDFNEQHVIFNYRCQGDSIEPIAPFSTIGQKTGGLQQGFYDTANQLGGGGFFIHGRAARTGFLLQHEIINSTQSEIHIRGSGAGMGAIPPVAIRLGGTLVTHISPVDTLGDARDNQIDLGFLGDVAVSPTSPAARWRTGYFGTDVQIGEVSLLKHTKNATIPDVTGSEDITLFFTDRALTITQLQAVVRGGSPEPSITVDIKYAADRSAAGTSILAAPEAVTSQTTGNTLTLPSPEPVIAANSWVWLETSGSPSNTVDELAITFIYLEG
jgi:hypothetical protein